MTDIELALYNIREGYGTKDESWTKDDYYLRTLGNTLPQRIITRDSGNERIEFYYYNNTNTLYKLKDFRQDVLVGEWKVEDKCYITFYDNGEKKSESYLEIDDTFPFFITRDNDLPNYIYYYENGNRLEWWISNKINGEKFYRQKLDENFETKPSVIIYDTIGNILHQYYINFECDDDGFEDWWWYRHSNLFSYVLNRFNINDFHISKNEADRIMKLNYLLNKIVIRFKIKKKK